MIQGYAAEIVKDDDVALNLHHEGHMINWRGQEEDPIVIDRFDGRALHDRSKFIKLKSRRRGDGMYGEMSAVTFHGPMMWWIKSPGPSSHPRR